MKKIILNLAIISVCIPLFFISCSSDDDLEQIDTSQKEATIASEIVELNLGFPKKFTYKGKTYESDYTFINGIYKYNDPVVEEIYQNLLKIENGTRLTDENGNTHYFDNLEESEKAFPVGNITTRATAFLNVDLYDNENYKGTYWKGSGITTYLNLGKSNNKASSLQMRAYNSRLKVAFHDGFDCTGKNTVLYCKVAKTLYSFPNLSAMGWSNKISCISVKTY